MYLEREGSGTNQNWFKSQLPHLAVSCVNLEKLILFFEPDFSSLAFFARFLLIGGEWWGIKWNNVCTQAHGNYAIIVPIITKGSRQIHSTDGVNLCGSQHHQICEDRAVFWLCMCVEKI